MDFQEPKQSFILLPDPLDRSIRLVMI